MGLEGTFRTNVEGGCQPRFVHAYQAVLEDIRPLAPYMRVLKLPIVDVPIKHRRNVRNELIETTKREFVRWVGETQEFSLKMFGLNVRQIDQICHTGKLGGLALPDRIASLSIDHIIPISCGGANNFSNLCFIPGWINNLKGRFEEAQLTLNPAISVLHVLVPPKDKDGKYPVFPYFPDEFYTFKNKSERQRRPAFDEHAQPTP